MHKPDFDEDAVRILSTIVHMVDPSPVTIPNECFDLIASGLRASYEAAGIALIGERDEARAAVRRLAGALEKLACLGNGDRPGNSVGNVMAQEALADPVVKKIVEGGG